MSVFGYVTVGLGLMLSVFRLDNLSTLNFNIKLKQHGKIIFYLRISLWVSDCE